MQHSIHSKCPIVNCSLEQRAAGQLVADDEADDAEHGDAAVDELRIGGEHGEAAPVLAALPRDTLRSSACLSRHDLALVGCLCVCAGNAFSGLSTLRTDALLPASGCMADLHYLNLSCRRQEGVHASNRAFDSRSRQVPLTAISAPARAMVEFAEHKINDTPC